MRWIPPQRWPVAVLLVGGAAGAAALLAEPLRLAAVRAGMHPAIGIAVSANLLYPGAIVLAAAYYPRARIVPLLALAAMLGFTLARCLVRDWHFWTWSPRFVADTLHPVVVVGGIVAGGLAAGAAALVGRWRRVGWPVDASRCGRCGYRLAGVEAARCPECGAARSKGPGRTEL